MPVKFSGIILKSIDEYPRGADFVLIRNQDYLVLYGKNDYLYTRIKVPDYFLFEDKFHQIELEHHYGKVRFYRLEL